MKKVTVIELKDMRTHNFNGKSSENCLRFVKKTNFCQRFHREERGGMAFSLLLFVVGLGVMIGFVANMASETIERERVQHAADSLAYASGVWLARGMNATSSCNHVMAERSAFAMMLNALAGPEYEFEPCYEEQKMTKRLQSDNILINLEKYAPNPKNKSQKETVKDLIDKYTDSYYPISGNKKIHAGAAVYDAKMNLKYYATDCLNDKAQATWLMDVKNSPKLDILEGFEMIGIGMHAVEDYVLGIGLNFNIGTTSGLLGSVTETIDGLSNTVTNVTSNFSSLTDSINESVDSIKNSGIGQVFSTAGNAATQLNQLNSNIKSLGSAISGLGKDIDSISNTVTNVKGSISNELNVLKNAGIDTSEIEKSLTSVQNEVSGLKNQLTSVGSGLKKDATKIASTGSDLMDVSSVINKATSAIDGVSDKINDAIKNAGSNIEQSLTGEVDKAINSINSKLNGVTSKINDAASNITKMSNVLSKYGDKIASVQSQLSDLQNLPNQLSSLVNLDGITGELGKIQDAVSNPINAITDSISGLTGNLSTDYKVVTELEKDICEEGNDSHHIRYEIYNNIEKIQKRISTVNGNKQENDYKNRLLYSKIQTTAEQLKTAYQTKDRDGFDSWVVAPLDTLVPDLASLGTQSDSSGSDSSSDSSDYVGKRALLPVIGEPQVTRLDGIGYMDNVENEAWTQKNASSPYDQLPTLPWTGSDEDPTIPTIQTAIRWIDYCADGAFAAAIVFYCYRYEFHKAAHAGDILTHLVALQTMGIDSSWRPGKYGHTNNPSVWSYPTKEFDYDVEKYSQWVRAAYPVVDSLRAGLRAYYSKEAKHSNLSTYLTAWSYRYVLSEAFYLKTGAPRPYQKQGSGETNYVIPFECFLFEIPGLDRKKKGEEDYWNDPEILDQMFSICAVVKSTPRDSIAAPTLFKRLGSKDGITAAAQATFYPYNGRNLTSDGKLATSSTATATVEKKDNCQPYTCWDTLQWRNYNRSDSSSNSVKEPIIYAPEWWNDKPSSENAMDYKTMIDPHPLDALEGARLEFSWDAMLSPVTKSRLEAVAKVDGVDSSIKKAAENAAKYHKVMAN